MNGPDGSAGRSVAWRVDEVGIDVVPERLPQGREREASVLWQRLRRRNTRLHDGPILAVRSVRGGAIQAVRERYWRFKTQRVLGVPIESVGVTAMIVRAEPVPSVLLCRRGEATDWYPGCWELGPAGLIDTGADTLDAQDIALQARREIREELGVALDCPMRPVALVYDADVPSWDVVVRADVGRDWGTDFRPGWECAQTRWVPAGELARFATAERLIAPSRAALSALGWLGGSVG